jgi:hypothetical protein
MEPAASWALAGSDKVKSVSTKPARLVADRHAISIENPIGSRRVRSLALPDQRAAMLIHASYRDVKIRRVE